MLKASRSVDGAADGSRGGRRLGTEGASSSSSTS